MQRFVNIYLEINKNKNSFIGGVYKMIFDNQKFYIGSSKNLHKRIGKWKHNLKINDTHNELVSSAFKECSEIKFEILEFVDNGTDPRVREDYYIKLNWGNPFLLNRSSDAFLPMFKKTEEQRLRKTKRKTQRVAQFDRNGLLIQIFESLKDANKTLFGRRLNLTKCFKKAGRYCGGFAFKKVDSNGNIIESPIIPNKKTSRAKGYKLSEETKEVIRNKKAAFKLSSNYKSPKLPVQTKSVNQFDLSGTLLITHKSIRSAAKSISNNQSSYRQLQRILSGKRSRTGYYKGNIYKYA